MQQCLSTPAPGQKDAQGSSVSCGTFLRTISSAKTCQAALRQSSANRNQFCTVCTKSLATVVCFNFITISSDLKKNHWKQTWKLEFLTGDLNSASCQDNLEKNTPAFFFLFQRQLSRIFRAFLGGYQKLKFKIYKSISFSVSPPDLLLCVFVVAEERTSGAEGDCCWPAVKDWIELKSTSNWFCFLEKKIPALTFQKTGWKLEGFFKKMYEIFQNLFHSFSGFCFHILWLLVKGQNFKKTLKNSTKGSVLMCWHPWLSLYPADQMNLPPVQFLYPF